MKKIKVLFFLLVLSGSISIYAQSVIGKWKTFDDKTGEAKSIVEITEKDGKIYGKIIEILILIRKTIDVLIAPIRIKINH